jgi:hypothetical protein
VPDARKYSVYGVLRVRGRETVVFDLGAGSVKVRQVLPWRK